MTFWRRFARYSTTSETTARGPFLNIPNLSFGLALAVLVGIACLSYRNTRRLEAAADDRRNSLMRLGVLQAFLTAALNVETGERGYVITGDELFLEPYHVGVARLDPELANLRDVLANEPADRQVMAELEESVIRLKRHFQLVVSLKAGQDDGSAQREVATGKGKRVMDQIRRHIAALGAADRDKIQQRDRQFESSLQGSLLIMVAGSLVGFSAVGLGAVAINHSLRERTRLNRRLQLALADNTETLDRLRGSAVDLTRSNQDLEQFAYVASHDLQEPLRKVSSFAQLLAAKYQGQLDGDADEFIGYIVDGSQRMQTLIQNLLAYSRLGRKGQPFAPVDVNTVLQQALENLEEAIADSGAVVTSDRLPTVPADAVQLVQLFQNLIGNAVKFCGAGKPLIHVGAEKTDATWTFSVQDNGIGIDLQFADRIFVIFQRLHNREEYAGTGIGLAFCKKIVERHGGRIWVESEPGQGSTFRFSIPSL